MLSLDPDPDNVKLLTATTMVLKTLVDTPQLSQHLLELTVNPSNLDLPPILVGVHVNKAFDDYVMSDIAHGPGQTILANFFEFVTLNANWAIIAERLVNVANDAATNEKKKDET